MPGYSCQNDAFIAPQFNKPQPVSENNRMYDLFEPSGSQSVWGLTNHGTNSIKWKHGWRVKNWLEQGGMEMWRAVVLWESLLEPLRPFSQHCMIDVKAGVITSLMAAFHFGVPVSGPWDPHRHTEMEHKQNLMSSDAAALFPSLSQNVWREKCLFAFTHMRTCSTPDTPVYPEAAAACWSESTSCLRPPCSRLETTQRTISRMSKRNVDFFSTAYSEIWLFHKLFTAKLKCSTYTVSIFLCMNLQGRISSNT